jgi:hypothetical protein
MDRSWIGREVKLKETVSKKYKNDTFIISDVDVPQNSLDLLLINEQSEIDTCVIANPNQIKFL